MGYDHPINVAYGVDFCKEIAIREYNPDQTKSLLTKSGITSAEIQVEGGVSDGPAPLLCNNALEHFPDPTIRTML